MNTPIRKLAGKITPLSNRTNVTTKKRYTPGRNIDMEVGIAVNASFNALMDKLSIDGLKEDEIYKLAIVYSKLRLKAIKEVKDGS